MTPRRIRVREYETIEIIDHIDDRDGSCAGKVTTREAALIREFQRESGKQVFGFGHHKIRTTNWVGSLAVGNVCIDVVPKIDTDANGSSFESAMENLLHMVNGAGLVPFNNTDISWLAKSESPLVTAFLELYIEHLRKEWIQGPIRRYVVQEENRFFIKGKILFNRHLRENAFHKERFFTASDEFTEDNPISRLLKAALVVCSKHRMRTRALTQAKTLLGMFENVSDVWDVPVFAENASNDRTVVRFKYLINLAKSILDRVSPWRKTSPVPVYSMMFDMNEVFEKFITEELRKALSDSAYRIEAQSSGLHLAVKKVSTSDGNKEVFWLRPDIKVFNNSASPEMPCSIIDTKWKLPVVAPTPRPKKIRSFNTEPISQQDMYQMYAYSQRYGCPVMLIYPYHSKLFVRSESPIAGLAEYRCDAHNGHSYIIKAYTIDIRLDLGDPGKRARLRQSLCSIILRFNEPESVTACAAKS